MERKINNNKMWTEEYGTGIKQHQKIDDNLNFNQNKSQKELSFNLFKQPIIFNYASSILQTVQQQQKINHQVIYQVSDVIYPHFRDIEAYNQKIKQECVGQNAKTSNYYFRLNLQQKIKRLIDIIQRLKFNQNISKQTKLCNNFSNGKNIIKLLKGAFQKINYEASFKKACIIQNNKQLIIQQNTKKEQFVSQQMRKRLEELSGLLIFKILMIKSQVFKIIQNYSNINKIYFTQNSSLTNSGNFKSKEKQNRNILSVKLISKEKSNINQNKQNSSETPVINSDYQGIYSTPQTKKMINFKDTIKKKKKQLSQTQTIQTKKHSQFQFQHEHNSLHSRNSYQVSQEKYLWEQNYLPTTKNIWQRTSIQNKFVKKAQIINQPLQQKRRYLTVRTNLYEFPLDQFKQSNQFPKKQIMKKLNKLNHDVLLEEEFDVSRQIKPIKLNFQSLVKKKQYSNNYKKIVDYQPNFIRVQRKNQKKEKRIIQKYYFQQEKKHNQVQVKHCQDPIKLKHTFNQTEAKKFKNIQNQKVQRNVVFNQTNQSQILRTMSERKVHSMPKVTFNTLRPNFLMKPNLGQKQNDQRQQNRLLKSPTFSYSRENNHILKNTYAVAHNAQKNSIQNKIIRNSAKNHLYENRAPQYQYYSRPLSPNQNILISNFVAQNKNYSSISDPKQNLLPLHSDNHFYQYKKAQQQRQLFRQLQLGNCKINKIKCQISTNKKLPNNKQQYSNWLAIQSKNSKIQQKAPQSKNKYIFSHRPKSMSAKIFVTLKNRNMY